MYLISYDIDKNKIRNRIAKTLENYGKRVQYSVFECEIDKGQFDKLYGELLTLMSGEVEGSIRVYQICKNCFEKIMVVGSKDYKSVKDEIDEIFIV